MEDIKKIAEDLIAKIQKNPETLTRFKDEPVETVQSLVNVKLPEEQIKHVVDLIKAKVSVDDLAGVAGKLKSLFGKK